MSASSVQLVKPPALRPGDTVGIVAPASNVRQPDLEVGCQALRRAGYRPFYDDSILDRDVYFAGSVERRVRELEAMFERDDVRAIVCARGGYGANYLLDQLDLEKIEAHPKIFVGYSDITSLLTHFTDVAGLVTFHGPMAAKDWAHEGGSDPAHRQGTRNSRGIRSEVSTVHLRKHHATVRSASEPVSQESPRNPENIGISRKRMISFE